MTTKHTIPVGNETVVAVHHHADTEDWLVFCHGFQSDKSGSYESRCERAVSEGYNAVRFDFRGCGESSRSFGEQTLSSRIGDLEAVLEYFDPPSVTVFGSSFGGKVCFHVAGTNDGIEAVATRAPVTYNRAFDNYRAESESLGTGGETRTNSGIGQKFFSDLDRHPFEAVVDRIEVPVCIFHGRDDESVAVEDSMEAVSELGPDTMIQLCSGEGHRFSREAEERMRNQLFEWLNHY